jgi:hypothetical protein
MPDMEDPNMLRKRLLFAAVFGFIVFSISLVTVWLNLRGQPNIFWMYSPLSDMKAIQLAIQEYQEEKHTLPGTLSQLSTIPDIDRMLPRRHNQALADSWGRPFHYWTDGQRYRIYSYGRDGKPGGAGFDYDFSIDNYSNAHRASAQSALTFRQFYFEAPVLRGMIWASIGAGLLAFGLGFIITRRHIGHDPGLVAIIGEILVTLIVSLVIAIILAVFHIPTGH